MKPYIVLNHVSKKFKGEAVIKDFSLQIEKGTICGFTGRNGSGKTVLFKLITGLLKADEGEIIINGKQIGRDIDFPENMGFIIENPGFLKQYNAYENLKYLAGINNKIHDVEIKSALKMVGLNSPH